MSYRARHALPDLGVGVGFRVPHYEQVLAERPPMDWFEVISENFMVPGGRPLDNLARLRAAYRVVPHGVSLAIGSVEPLDASYLVPAPRARRPPRPALGVGSPLLGSRCRASISTTSCRSRTRPRPWSSSSSA